MVPLQQEQPAPWSEDFSVFGSLADFSLVVRAARVAWSISVKNGVEKNARDDDLPQLGQPQGSAETAIGRISVNAPQSTQL